VCGFRAMSDAHCVIVEVHRLVRQVSGGASVKW
jgi:hypothetical protein